MSPGMAQSGMHPDGRGQRIGDYEVLRYLTAGGMADLYLARSPRQDEPVVVKQVQARYLADERVVAMFRDEGQIGGLLDHPNIVRVIEVAGEEVTPPFIAMEYIDGHDLIEVLRLCTERQVAMPRELGVAICGQVARGLAYAHDLRGPGGRALEVVHCDVSPGNVMLSWRGTVKLVDFGVARARIHLHCPERGVEGKHGYMAPEQILGQGVDRRTDLFSLGVILYELTCSRRLFRGRPEVVMRRILEEPIPPPRQICPDYPADLEAVVMRALSRDPAARYPTAEALRVDLMAVALGMPPSGRPELARFLGRLYGRPPELDRGGEREEETRDTVDLGGLGARGLVLRILDLDEDLTTEARAAPDDREEALLTRMDTPLLRPDAPLAKALPRDPERTGVILAPGSGGGPGRRRRHSGGVTTHMFGEGSTRPAYRLQEVPADGRAEGPGAGAERGAPVETALVEVEGARRRRPFLTEADRRLIGWACVFALVLLCAAYFFAQR
jgi:hypothetical protein